MIRVMHNTMFAVAPYIVPLGALFFLGGWFIGVATWDLRPPMIGMLLTLLLAALVALYVLIYWLIGGTQAYPHG